MNRRPGWVSITALILAVLFLLPAPKAAAAGTDETELEIEEIILEDAADEDWFEDLFSNEQEPAEPEAEPETENPARTAFIDDIIERGKKEFEKTRGKLQRAQYKEDIYICKNFTVYLFRSVRDGYRMAEYPDVKLKIPDNLPSAQCRPYAYGYAWKEVPASERILTLLPVIITYLCGEDSVDVVDGVVWAEDSARTGCPDKNNIITINEVTNIVRTFVLF